MLKFQSIFSFLYLLFFSLLPNITTSTLIGAKPNCQTKCGDVIAPYPFGIGIGLNCSKNHWFELTCDTFHKHPFMLIFAGNYYRVTEISNSQIRIKSDNLALRCKGNSVNNITMYFSGTPYTLSDSNKLTHIGCSDMAILEGSSSQFSTLKLTQKNFASGCISFCSDANISLSGSCPGNACCQIQVPKGTVFVNSSMTGVPISEMDKQPCSFSFLGEMESFPFDTVVNMFTPSKSILSWKERVPVALDWRIGEKSCTQAQKSDNYACQNNSNCIDANGGGYRCRCFEGYQGNPYLPLGCLS